MHNCEHMILGQLRMGARQAKNAPLVLSLWDDTLPWREKRAEGLCGVKICEFEEKNKF